MPEKTFYMFFSENEIVTVFEEKNVNKFENEIDLQRYLVKKCDIFSENLLLIKDWSYDKKVLPLIRRKHDLVFLSIEEFPPKFWLIETKMKFAHPDDPFSLFTEVSERVSLWKHFGLSNIMPYYIQPAPQILQNHSFIQAYCAILSYFKQIDDERVYESLWLRTHDEQKIWGFLDDAEIEELSTKELKTELKKRNRSAIGRRPTLIKELKSFQTELEEKEGIAVNFLDLIINLQDWSLLSGISSVRITQSEGKPAIVIVPPYAPIVIHKLFNLSKGSSGDNYTFWDLKKNCLIKNPPTTPDELSDIILKMCERDKYDIFGNLGILIIEDISSEYDYSMNLEDVKGALQRYSNSWRSLMEADL